MHSSDSRLKKWLATGCGLVCRLAVCHGVMAVINMSGSHVLRVTEEDAAEMIVTKRGLNTRDAIKCKGINCKSCLDRESCFCGGTFCSPYITPVAVRGAALVNSVITWLT